MLTAPCANDASSLNSVTSASLFEPKTLNQKRSGAMIVLHSSERTANAPGSRRHWSSVNCMKLLFTSLGKADSSGKRVINVILYHGLSRIVDTYCTNFIWNSLGFIRVNRQETPWKQSAARSSSKDE